VGGLLVNLEETMSEVGRLCLTLMVTEDLKLAISPKKILKPKLREAIREHKGEIVCELMWASYLDWIDYPTELPPSSPALKEAYGYPRTFYRALMEYDHVRENYELIEHPLVKERGAVIMSERGLLIVDKDEDAPVRKVEE